MAGFPLTGIDPLDPTPGIIREIKFNQGEGLGGGNSRSVVLIGVGNAATTGLTVDTISDPVSSEAEVISLVGAGSELHLMYRAFTAVPQQADISLARVALSSGGSPAAATVDFTFATASDANTSVKVKCIGEEISVGVADLDTAAAVATAVFNAINAQPHWPVSATNPSSGVVRMTSKHTGVRHGWPVTQASMSFTKATAMTVTKGSVTAGVDGSTAEDQSNILALLANKTYYYQVNGMDKRLSGVTISATDGSIGEHATQIKNQHSPSVGKDQVLIYATVGGNQGNATTDASSAFLNDPLVVVVFAGDNCWWTAGMLAAQVCAAKRAKEIAHPGANLTGYGKKSEDQFTLPRPASAADEMSASEIRACLNGGVTPISFTQSGQAFIVRQITSKSTTGGVADYRAREGHIPSCMHYTWGRFADLYQAQAQQFVADDPADGEKPLQGVTYPRAVRALWVRVIEELCGPAFPGGPVLDPSYKQAMIDSIEVVRLPDGISSRVKPVAVKHNNKGQFLIEESSVGY